MYDNENIIANKNGVRSFLRAIACLLFSNRGGRNGMGVELVEIKE